jgi:glutathione S-transferase
MVSTERLMTLAAAARAPIRDAQRITLVGDEDTPRFELFHAASSLCSQKVRTVLHEKELPYRSNEMIILSSMGEDGRLLVAEHYSAPYVRLRLLAAREIDREFVNGYSGRTSVETEGFDPCVVPLLVDYEAGRVVADSKRICTYLDAISPEPVRLVPDGAQAEVAVMRQVDIVDRIPNGALLYGFHPDDDRRPEPLKLAMNTAYDYKVRALEELIAAHADEPELVAAFRAKIVKERGGKQVCRDAAFQRAARAHVAQLLADLERDLSAATLFGLRHDAFSLADAMWGVNLVRMHYLGLSSMWKKLPGVDSYFRALVRRPSLSKEAIQASVNSMPPSTYMNAIVQPATQPMRSTP